MVFIFLITADILTSHAVTVLFPPSTYSTLKMGATHSFESVLETNRNIPEESTEMRTANFPILKCILTKHEMRLGSGFGWPRI
jgi:hypothetical protein